jgi:hypothetical protein
MDASQDERWLAEASVPGDDTDGAALFCNAFKDYSFSSLPQRERELRQRVL